MKISEITLDSKDITVEGTVVKVDEPRVVNTRFGQKKVATATIEDDSGQIDLSLWEDNISLLKEGKTIEITGGYVTEWRDKLQINLPRTGKIEIK
ncbi:MAG: DNA-binding protein [DPANN group archaeon]|nr:DNA-binding protein [DPANN group archaeon]